jgi:hypothetical protein
MNISSSRPAVNIHGPAVVSFNHSAAPPTVVNSATEPTIGQGLPWGT